MKEVFEEIALHENGVLKCFDNNYSNFDGSKIFSTVYKLELNYKEHKILIVNELGQQNIGSVELKIELGTKISNFEISSRSHFWKLFNKRSNILKVECNNVSLKSTLEKLIINTGLEKIAKENLFQPNIFTKSNDYKDLAIITEYHLNFPDKKGALISLIQFYKQIIDNI